MVILLKRKKKSKMEITLKPTQTLEIQEMFELPLDTLVTNQALSGGNLMWMDGILICFGGYSNTDKLIHEQVEGFYHWLHLEYTFDMKEYTPTLKAKLLNHQVPVYNMSYHPFYKDVGEFIKFKHKEDQAIAEINKTIVTTY